MEETHLRHMKTLLGSYAHSVEDTHVQIGQVHEEFKQNIENISVEMLLRKFAESKGTGREKPGESGHLGVRLRGKDRVHEAGDFPGSQFPHQ
ncbi:PREDICTED: F-BAR domain only protein 1-like [Myotis brandtii]|uniref:F-BAR domain only protein 1-like n=1 Tax=Myotis brandtii TaxID=109478 RepID=UPI0003BBA47C|nr:PREDICTED: F-BAR domain only protein 1-like [Myotis brandtii]